MSLSLFSLEGRVALITGGNSGIGRALALAYRDAGARVAIAARRADRNAEALAELGPDHAAFELDVSDEASIERVVEAVKQRFVCRQARFCRLPGLELRGQNHGASDGFG